MKKIDFNLLKSIGRPQTIIDGMLDRQIQALETSLGRNAAGAGNKLLSLFVKGGYRMQLSPAVVTKKMKAISRLSEAQVLGLVEKLHESGLLRKTTSGQYELANNFMARQAHEKVEAENRVLRTIKSTINDRMGRAELLDQSYLNYIVPSLPQIDLNKDEKVFIDKSKAALRRRRQFMSFVFWASFILMGVFATGAIYNYLRANRALGISQGHVEELEIEKAKTEEAKLKAEKAQEKAEDASEEADEARKEAEAEKAIAEALRNAAFADRDSITRLKQEADTLIIKLGRLKGLAEERAANEKALKEMAEDASKEADDARLKAEKLNKIITSRIAANRSLQIEDVHMRSLVAQEAYNINKVNSEGDIYHPSIVKAMYSAVAAKNEGIFTAKEIVGSVKDIVVSSAGDAFYTTGSDGKVREWKVNHWNQVGKPVIDNIKIYDPTSNFVLNTLSLSNDNKRLLAAGDGNVFRIFSTETGKRLSKYNYEPTDETIYEAEFDEEGNFCGVGKKHTYFLFEGHLGDIQKQEFSYQKKGDDRSALITLPRTKPSKLSLFRKIGKENRVYTFQGDFVKQYSQYVLYVQIFDGHTNKTDEYTLANGSAEEIDYGKMTAVAFKSLPGKKGLLIYGFEKGRIMIIRLDDLTADSDIILGGEKKIYKAHQAAISDIKLSKTGQFLAVASYDGSVSVWDMSRYADAAYQPMVFEMPSWALSVAFADNDETLITGCKDGSLYFWNINPDNYADYLCGALHTGKDDYVKRQMDVSNNLKGVRIKSSKGFTRYNEMSRSDYEKYFGKIEDTGKPLNYDITICQ